MKANWLDRAIGAVAPGMAARRLRERAMFETLSRAYEAATPGRQNAGWRRSSSSADTEIAAHGATLRDHMRELVRNDPHASKAVSVLVSHFIGDGIMPRIADKKLRDLWDDWARNCDADGQLDFAGVQTLAVREMLEGGESIVRRRRRRASDGLKVPVQVQILEADHFDTSRNALQAGTGQNLIRQGIEFDQIGRRVAYWLYQNHPGSEFVDLKSTIQSVRVPAGDVLHIYEKQRTQLHGIPWGTPALTSLRDWRDYENAELLRKKLEACVVGIITAGDQTDMGLGISLADDPNQPPGVYDTQGALVERFEPGMFAFARGGKDIKFNQPAQSGTYDAAKRTALHTIAAGFRIPYELLTGDLSQVSFISGRMGLLEFRRLVSMVQWQILIPQLCEPTWRWFCEAAYAAGLIPDPVVPVEWSPPEFTTIDPLNDAQADLISLRTGTRSWDEVVAAKGHDPDAKMNEIAARLKKFDALGLVFDGDPRLTTKAGILQVAETAPSGGAKDATKPPKA